MFQITFKTYLLGIEKQLQAIFNRGLFFLQLLQEKDPPCAPPQASGLVGDID